MSEKPHTAKDINDIFFKYQTGKFRNDYKTKEARK